jgi:hypothetical protein
MKTYRELLEDIELVTGVGRVSRQENDAMQDEFDRIHKKKLGKIHKDYSIHKSGRDFFITHDKSKKVVGHFASDAPSSKKQLRVSSLGIHPDHTKKKIGHSLAVAAYKHLHGKHGYEIHSDTAQTPGGASVWRELMKDPSTSRYVHAVHHPLRGKKTELGQASKLHTGDIWQSGSGSARRTAASKGIKMHPYKGNDPAYDTKLVLKRKKK